MRLSDEPTYDIVVIDHGEDQALVPVRNVRYLPVVRRRSRARVILITAAAAALCAAAGFGAGMLMAPVPAPRVPEAPAELSSVRSWFASNAPVRVEPLALVGDPLRATALAGWVAGSDIGGRGVAVRLVASAGLLTTLAIDLHAEPRMATLRGVSSRAFDIEIGPVAGTVRAQDLAAPESALVVRGVTVRPRTGSADGFVRVRVNLHAPGQGNLRVVGRTIYADFAALAAAS